MAFGITGDECAALVAALDSWQAKRPPRFDTATILRLLAISARPESFLEIPGGPFLLRLHLSSFVFRDRRSVQGYDFIC